MNLIERGSESKKTSFIGFPGKGIKNAEEYG